MAEERKYMTALRLSTNPELKAELEKLYAEEHRTVKEVASLMNASPNTIMLALGVLGYPYEPWLEERVFAMKKKVMAYKKRHQRVREPV